MSGATEDERRSRPSMSDEAAPFALRLKAPRTSTPGAEPSDVERLRAHGRWNDLIELLLAQHDAAASPSERARLLTEIAEIFQEGLDDPAQAYDALVEAWRADPTYDPAIGPLEGLARDGGRWPDLIAATEALVASEREGKRALALYERMVWWLTVEVPTPQLAAHYAERIRIADSTHSAVHLHQAGVFRAHGDLRRELEELDRAALSARRPEDRAKLHVMMALRFNEERLKNPTETKKHLLAALAQDPRCMAALRGLEVIYERDKDVPALVAVLEKHVEAARVESERVAVLLRLADLYEKHLLKPDLAAEKLQVALALDPQNEGALASLERCYTATRSWSDLARALEVVGMSDDPALRVASLRKLAEVQESRLDQPAEACKTYQELQRLVPTDEATLTNLARLTDRLGDWRASAQWRSKLADIAPDDGTRARLHVAVGQLLSAPDREPSVARVHFEEAAELDPANEAAWNALAWDARQAGDYARLARYLEQRAAAADSPRRKGELFVELAQLRADPLGDEVGALEAYEQARAADPTNENAASALLELYVASERWEEANALCERAAMAAERDGDQGRLVWALRLGRKIALAFGDEERALAIAISCFDLRPDSPDVQEDLVESALLFREAPHRLTKARDSLALLADRASELTPALRARLGEALSAAGDSERARALYESALAEEPGSAAALAGLAASHRTGGDRAQAAEYARRLARAMTDPEEKARQLIEAAETFVKAQRPDLAAETYEEARALQPKNHQLLHALLAVYQRLERWQELSGVLRAVIESDTDPRRKSKTAFALGQIAREKLADPDGGLAFFEEALDHDPTHLEAFEKIVRILTDQRDWPRLAESYRKMIGRVLGGGDPKLQHALYHQLGLVYRDRLRDMDLAALAFRSATEIRPDAAEDQAILRELLAMKGQVQDAVVVAMEQARRDPLAPGPYPALFELLVREGQLDRAWCVASIMAHLGILSDPHAGFFRSRPSRPLAALTGALNEHARLYLLHPDLDRTLSAILQTLAPALIEQHVSQVPWRDRLTYPGPGVGGRGTPLAWLSDAVEQASARLGVPTPTLHARSGIGPALMPAPTRSPALLASIPVLEALPQTLHPFVVGKRVFELMPVLLARAVCPTVTELTAALGSAARIVASDKQPRAPADEALRTKLKRAELAVLADAVSQGLARGLGVSDVERWSQLADLSSSRAGLLLVGDVELARAALVREPQGPSDMPLREQTRELVTFALSDAFAQMRQVLGAAVTS